MLPPTKHIHDRHVSFHVGGQATLRQIKQVLLGIGADADALELKLVLLDVRDLEVSLSKAERFSLGEAAAQSLRPLRKVAVVQAPNSMRGFSTMVASNRGLTAESFLDIGAALAWLQA